MGKNIGKLGVKEKLGINFNKPLIKDVWGHFCSDLNWRRHPVGPSNKLDDFPQLTPEKMVEWYKSINGNRLAWCWIKYQSGHAAFPSNVLPRMEKLSTDFFQRYCELSKAEGMYVVGYTDGGDDIYAFEKHPEWFHEYGHGYACLNTPFWDREFEAIQEALNIFPCDGLFYDMVRFSGKCRCEFCNAAYKRFYGEKMPKKYNTNKFRFDTFKHWVEHATRIPREIVPTIEICVNHQWLRLDGMPYELLECFDWYYCEFGQAEWIGEILRAWKDKPLFSGNAINPRYVAHLLGRRVSSLAYDTFTDYRTGKFVSVDDRRVKPIKQVLGEVRKQESYLKDTITIPHTTVLFTSAYDLSKISTDENYAYLLLTENKYAEMIATYVREATRMNLSCCVEIVERLTKDKLDQYEIVFALELPWLDKKVVALLHEWVKKGGILFVGGLFILINEHRELLQDFTDNGLLGVKKIEGPLDTFSVLDRFQSNGKFNEMEELVPIDNAIICESKGAKPVAYGSVGADNNVPLIWQHKVDDGIVFFLTGRIGTKLEENIEKRECSFRQCLKELLSPYIKKTPFKTTTEYPTEVWLNNQPTEKRLILHVVAYDKPLYNQQISIRSDLVTDNNMELVYPVSKKTIIKGEKNKDYIHFILPEIYEHVIFTLKKS